MVGSITYSRDNFNPLHREGGDDDMKHAIGFDNHFNPLHREGGDSVLRQIIWIALNFNPLHREGGDKVYGKDALWVRISIHSTARVETAGICIHHKPYSISIHSTARVETR